MTFNMKKLFSLGELYVSDFIKQDEEARAGKHDLTLMIDGRYGAARLEKCTPIHSMFGKYWYRSGVNTTMKKELSDIVDNILKVQQLERNDLWLDIACNDGTLFKYVPNHIKKLGIDPTDDTFTVESRQVADEIIQDYFTLESYKKSQFAEKRAKVITCIAMFYDLENFQLHIRRFTEIREEMVSGNLFNVQPLVISETKFVSRL